MKTRAKNKIQKPNTKLNLMAQTTHQPIKIPTSVAEALKDPNWRQAMIDEIHGQLKHRTWDLVPPNGAQNLVTCKWIFTVKYRAEGFVERYKARLVARGFNQKYGLDCSETFGAVIRLITIRLVLDVAVKKNWRIHQLDINNVFLHGTLEDEVYVFQPPGFVDKDLPHYVCRLNKALYKLKQTPRAWYTELRHYLLAMDF